MYKRWKKLKKDLGINKKDIKTIRRIIPGEKSLKKIEIIDEDGSSVLILYDTCSKSYEVYIHYSYGLSVETPLLKWIEEPIYYDSQELIRYNFNKGENIVRLYLDDIRIPKDEHDVIVRSYDEAIEFVKKNGIPSYISFDHDLGCNDKGDVLKNGYDFAKWLVDMDIENIYKFPEDFSFNVHSANPIGRKNIETLLNNYLAFKRD